MSATLALKRRYVRVCVCDCVVVCVCFCVCFNVCVCLRLRLRLRLRQRQRRFLYLITHAHDAGGTVGEVGVGRQCRELTTIVTRRCGQDPPPEGWGNMTHVPTNVLWACVSQISPQTGKKNKCSPTQPSKNRQKPPCVP